MSTKINVSVDSKNVKSVIKEPVQKVGKDNEKYIALLKLLNALNVGRAPIEDITEFVNVDRNDILKDENKDVLKNMENDIFPPYDKKKCGYYKKNADSFTLNVLRAMVKETGHKLFFKQKEVYEVINGRNYRTSVILYSIN